MLAYKGSNKFSNRDELISHFSSIPVLGLDSEWDKEHLLVIALATDTEGIVADEEDIQTLLPILQGTPLVIHNASYDKWKIEQELDITLTLHDDSMMLAQSCGYMGALEYLSFPFNFSHRPVTTLLYSSSGATKVRKNLSECTREELGNICLEHAMGSYKVWSQLKDTAPLSYWQDMELFPLLEEITARGISLNTSLIQQKYDRLSTIVGYMKDRAEIRGYNPGSTTQVGIYLSMKGINTGFTKTGKMRTDRESLKPFIDDEDVALILKYKELQKLCSTYLKPLLDCGREYPRYRVVSTGRLSSSPNIQNIPTEMRDIYIPDEGDWMVSLDLHQIEPRIAAHLSQDPRLLNDAFSGDVYQPVSDRLGISRKEAKVLWLGVSYGGASGDMAELVGEFHRQYPVYAEWAKKQMAKAEKLGYAETMLGRKRNIEEQTKDAPNSIIQGTAAEVMKDMMFELRKYKILASVHDEVLISMPDGTLPQFNLTSWNGIPLRVKTKAGYNYRDLEDITVE